MRERERCTRLYFLFVFRHHIVFIYVQCIYMIRNFLFIFSYSYSQSHLDLFFVILLYSNHWFCMLFEPEARVRSLYNINAGTAIMEAEMLKKCLCISVCPSLSLRLLFSLSLWSLYHTDSVSHGSHFVQHPKCVLTAILTSLPFRRSILP